MGRGAENRRHKKRQPDSSRSHNQGRSLLAGDASTPPRPDKPREPRPGQSIAETSEEATCRQPIEVIIDERDVAATVPDLLIPLREKIGGVADADAVWDIPKHGESC